MKKLGLILVTLIVFVGCTKMEEYPIPDQITGTDLKIQSAVGIKLQSQFVTSEVAMNVKSDVAQTVTVKITDISNKVVSFIMLLLPYLLLIYMELLWAL